jgi:hypothetical protein
MAIELVPLCTIRIQLKPPIEVAALTVTAGGGQGGLMVVTDRC